MIVQKRKIQASSVASASPGDPAKRVDPAELEQRPRHPIGVVALRTGIPQILLRAWERRYQAVVPCRSKTGRRLYTDQDIERLRLMQRAVAAGRRISDVAHLPLDDLQDLAAEDTAQVPPGHLGSVETESLGDAPPEVFLEHALRAIAELNRERLEQLLADATLAFSRPVLRQQLLAPLLHAIGERWRSGEFRIMHEHLASAVLRSHLAALRDGALMPASTPLLVITTPAGQLHEFGALLAAMDALDCGWDVIYLGPNLPAEEIAAATQVKQATAVGLSIVYPGHDARLPEELRNLRRYLGRDVVILVGGRAAKAYRDVLAEIDAREVSDLSELSRELAALSG